MQLYNNNQYWLAHGYHHILFYTHNPLNTEVSSPYVDNACSQHFRFHLCWGLGHMLLFLLPVEIILLSVILVGGFQCSPYAHLHSLTDLSECDIQ